MYILLHLLFILPEINKTHDTKVEIETQIYFTNSKYKNWWQRLCIYNASLPTAAAVNNNQHYNETWQTKRCFLWSRRTCLIICCLHWRMMCCAQTATTCALPFGMKQRSFLAHLQSTTIQDQNLCLCFWRRMRGGWMSNTCVQSSCSWTHCCQRRRSSPLLIAGRGSYKDHKRGIWTPQPPPDCVARSGRTLCVVIWTQWPGRGGLQKSTNRQR